MDSNTSFIWNPSALHSVYYHQDKEDHDGIIDLGLSLKTHEPDEAYHPSAHVSLEGYGELVEWPQVMNSHPESRVCEEKERWAYVKVNMDGVVVGRKICMPDHGGYSSLAHELEDMFGRQCVSGLSLFQAGSEFSLFYKDREGKWRTVGDVPWKEFVDCVTRLRIKRKNVA